MQPATEEELANLQSDHEEASIDAESGGHSVTLAASDEAGEVAQVATTSMMSVIVGLALVGMMVSALHKLDDLESQNSDQEAMIEGLE